MNFWAGNDTLAGKRFNIIQLFRRYDDLPENVFGFAYFVMRAFNDNTQKNLNIIRKIALNLIADFKREAEIINKTRNPTARNIRFARFNVVPPITYKIQLLICRCIKTEPTASYLYVRFFLKVII